MRLRELIVLGVAGCAAVSIAAANEAQVTAPERSATQPQEPRSAPEPATPALDLLETTRLTAQPIAHLKRFDPERLRPTAGPAFLVGAWQQQLFFQRSIDARNPYYGTGLPR